jgi:hypothetical protein
MSSTPASDPSARPWYRKKRHIAWMALVGLIVAILISGDPASDGGTTTGTFDTAAADDEPAEAESADPCDSNSDSYDPAACETAMNDRATASAGDESAEEPEPDPPADEPEPETVVEDEPARFRKRDYQDLSARDVSKLLRDPDANAGEKVRLWGEVMQFDSNTGGDAMLAHVSGDRDDCEFDICDYFSEGELALLVANGADFDDVLEQDHIAVYGTLVGTFDYETAMTAQATVPSFSVERIRVIGEAE